jgi:hypothetical protein
MGMPRFNAMMICTAQWRQREAETWPKGLVKGQTSSAGALPGCTAGGQHTSWQVVQAQDEVEAKAAVARAACCVPPQQHPLHV